MCILIVKCPLLKHASVLHFDACLAYVVVLSGIVILLFLVLQPKRCLFAMIQSMEPRFQGIIKVSESGVKPFVYDFDILCLINALQRHSLSPPT